MAKPQTIISESEAQTIAFAQSCAATAKNGDIFTLQGPLGAGKSVFARAFIQHLAGNTIDVPSPTFTLVQTYDSDKGAIWHFDLYRLKEPEEIYEIGWEEAIAGNINIVEWPERLGALLPSYRKEIIFEAVSDESSKITLINHSEANDA